MKQHMFLGTLLTVFVLCFQGIGIAQGDFRCEIYVSNDDSCKATITIEKGELVLLANGEFSLTGIYNSCYHREELVLTGKFNTTSFTERMVFELLATTLRRNGEVSMNFPRTVGAIIVNNKTMKGVFYDVWALIRSPGSKIQSPVARTIVCKSQ